METAYSFPRGQAPSPIKLDVKIPIKIIIDVKIDKYGRKRYFELNILSKYKCLVAAEGDLHVFCLKDKSNLDLIIDTSDVSDFYEVKRIYLTGKVN